MLKDKIIELLKKNPNGLKAVQIEKFIPNVTKKQINQILYSNSCFVNNNFVWTYSDTKISSNNSYLTNKKLLKEWQKIESANIFESLEDFAKFYYKNGEKSCFRIVTNEPWSKENFFFGTYQELLDFYKNELPKRSIGKKYHHITVLDVFKDNKDGKERWYAKCKCDCGKTAIKLYESIKDGNARTCGCKMGKGAHEGSSLYDLFPEIVDTYWDFERNTKNPQDIPIFSRDKFWWKGYNGSFEMPIQTLLEADSGTSFPEQAISFFIKQNGIEVVNRHLINFGKKNYELDIFLPQLNLGVEYDGVFWHSKKVDKDIKKNEVMEKSNITLVRIREKGLKPTGIKNGKEIILTDLINNTCLANCINELFLYIESLSQLKIPSIQAEDIAKNKLLIQKQYAMSYKNDSVANHWLNFFWNEENDIEPYLIPIDSKEYFWFSCVLGRKFFNSPKNLINKANLLMKNNNTCFFYSTNFCFRCDCLQITIDSVELTNNGNYITILFSLDNDTSLSFKSVDLGVCYLLSNLDSTNYKNNFSLSNISSSIDFPEHSKKQYAIIIDLINNCFLSNSNSEFVYAVNLCDYRNFIYKLCINISINDNKYRGYAKIFLPYTHKTFTNTKELNVDFVNYESKKPIDSVEIEHLSYETKTYTEPKIKGLLN